MPNDPGKDELLLEIDRKKPIQGWAGQNSQENGQQ